MYKDPVVEEVRRIRFEIEEECQHDEGRYYEHLRQAQAKYADLLVRRGPKTIKEIGKSA